MYTVLTMDEVRVLIGDKRYVTLYTITKINSLISNVEAMPGPQGIQGIQGIQGVKGDTGDSGYSTGSALPTPSISHRGKLFTLLGTAGVADIVYVCLKKADNTYAWQDMLTFRFG